MDENRAEPKRPYEFADPMKRWERVCALIYLCIHVAVLPFLLDWLMVTWPGEPLDELTLNYIYYGMGLLFSLAVMGRYLRRGFDTLCDNLLGVILAMLAAYIVQIMLNFALQLILMASGDALGTPPNNEALISMADKNYYPVMALAVFVAPMVEEPLFRGAVFGSLRKTGRALAYGVSVAAFSLYHVWQYAVAYGDASYLLYAALYVPASAALCYAYEKSGSIWTPILFHMLVNLVSMSVLA